MSPGSGEAVASGKHAPGMPAPPGYITVPPVTSLLSGETTRSFTAGGWFTEKFLAPSPCRRTVSLGPSSGHARAGRGEFCAGSVYRERARKNVFHLSRRSGCFLNPILTLPLPRIVPCPCARIRPGLAQLRRPAEFGDIAEGNVAEFLKFLPGVNIGYSGGNTHETSLNGVPGGPRSRHHRRLQLRERGRRRRRRHQSLRRPRLGFGQQPLPHRGLVLAHSPRTRKRGMRRIATTRPSAPRRHQSRPGWDWASTERKGRRPDEPARARAMRRTHGCPPVGAVGAAVLVR